MALGILDVADFAAGSHYGAPTAVPWGVTYTSRFAARTSGVPLGIALHPVQLYAAIGHFVLAAVLILLLRHGGRPAEVIGTALFADGVLRFALAPLSGSYAIDKQRELGLAQRPGGNHRASLAAAKRHSIHCDSYPSPTAPSATVRAHCTMRSCRENTIVRASAYRWRVHHPLLYSL